MNKKVVNVNWESEKVQIKCGDESEFSADHVIVTLPLGVLKAHHQTLFTPHLPEAKIKSIQDIGFGTLGKIYLEFDERFFEGEIRFYNFLWSDADLESVKGTDREW